MNTIDVYPQVFRHFRDHRAKNERIHNGGITISWRLVTFISFVVGRGLGLARMQLRPIRDPVKLMTRLTRFVGNVRARYEVFTRYDRRGSPARVEDTLKSCTFRERSDVYRGQKHLPSLKATPLSIRCAISLSRNSNDETCMCVRVCVCFAPSK